MFDTKPVDIKDILTMDVDLSELYIDVDEEEAGNEQTCSKESPVDMTFAVEEDIPENVLKVLYVL